jgi:hypothetical protein
MDLKSERHHGWATGYANQARCEAKTALSTEALDSAQSKNGAWADKSVFPSASQFPYRPFGVFQRASCTLRYVTMALFPKGKILFEPFQYLLLIHDKSLLSGYGHSEQKHTA